VSHEYRQYRDKGFAWLPLTKAGPANTTALCLIC
jgi:hypothetical protein